VKARELVDRPDTHEASLEDVGDMPAQAIGDQASVADGVLKLALVVRRFEGQDAQIVLVQEAGNQVHLGALDVPVPNRQTI